MHVPSAIVTALLTTLASAQMRASFTAYGTGDPNGSPNCARTTNACGRPAGGFTAAISERQFGKGGGQGPGPGCGQCWELTIQRDSLNKPVQRKTIKVKVDNLCPAPGSEWCQVPNRHGADVHFDLCIDSGASGALFPRGVGAGLGTARRVAC